MNIDEPITIEPYNPAWVTHFASERAVLCHALSIELSRVEHIGSTSVAGMQAKPIVDMMLGLDSFPPLLTVTDRLYSLGYEALGEAGVPGRLYFRKRLPNAFNVQAVLFGGPLWKNNLLMRDFLAAHPVEARRYADDKISRLSRWPQDAPCLLGVENFNHDGVASRRATMEPSPLTNVVGY